MRIGALNTRMSEMELTVIDSEVETIGRVNGRSIWKLCTSSTLVFAGPERMDSIPGGGERKGGGLGGFGGLAWCQ